MDNLFVLHPNIRENIHVGKWDFFYEQISCGKFSAQVRSAEFSDSLLMVEEDCNQPLMSGGRLGDSHISLTIHSPTNSHGIFCGKPMGSAHVGLLAPDRDFELYTKTPLNIFTLTLGISDPKFQEVSQLLIDYFQRNYRNGDVIENIQLANALREFKNTIAGDIFTSPGLIESQLFKTHAEDVVIFSLIEKIEHSLKGGTPNRPVSASAWLVSEFRKEVLASRANQFSLTKTCEKLGVAHRTLHKCISESLGIGPLLFCRYIRLNSARKALIEANRNNKQRSIAEIAEEYGFWHLPRFSAYYRAMFSELPSQTLKSNN